MPPPPRSPPELRPALNPKPSTPNPQPSTRTRLTPSPQNPKTLNPKTLNPKPYKPLKRGRCLSSCWRSSMLADWGPPYSTRLAPHRPLSSSFLGLPYRILNIIHKKELLRGLWVRFSGLCPEFRVFGGLGFSGIN